eukprot:3777055-Pleurochrysis_carterae.AAC.3
MRESPFRRTGRPPWSCLPCPGRCRCRKKGRPGAMRLGWGGKGWKVLRPLRRFPQSVLQAS